MIKAFKDWLNESIENDFSEEELTQAEKDTLEYDSSLDADPNDYPDFEDDFCCGEEEEE